VNANNTKIAATTFDSTVWKRDQVGLLLQVTTSHIVSVSIDVIQPLIHI
jgi:hypothetical protein